MAWKKFQKRRMKIDIMHTVCVEYSTEQATLFIFLPLRGTIGRAVSSTLKTTTENRRFVDSVNTVAITIIETTEIENISKN